MLGRAAAAASAQAVQAQAVQGAADTNINISEESERRKRARESEEINAKAISKVSRVQKEMVRQGSVKGRTPGETCRTILVIKIGIEIQKSLKKILCSLEAASPVMHLSFYEAAISGIEYRHNNFSFCKASLPSYYYDFIRSLTDLLLSNFLSYYYPGPSIFHPPLLNQIIPHLIPENHTSDLLRPVSKKNPRLEPLLMDHDKQWIADSMK